MQSNYSHSEVPKTDIISRLKHSKAFSYSPTEEPKTEIMSRLEMVQETTATHTLKSQAQALSEV